MKKLLATTTFALALAISGAASADMTASQAYLQDAIAKLPPQQAQEFRDDMNEAHEQNRDLYEQIHALHNELHDILIADSFDSDAFIVKSGQLRQLHDQMGANLDQAFADAAADLTPRQRLMLAKALERSHAAMASHAAAKKASE